jgi:hypothetical protein
MALADELDHLSDKSPGSIRRLRGRRLYRKAASWYLGLKKRPDETVTMALRPGTDVECPGPLKLVLPCLITRQHELTFVTGSKHLAKHVTFNVVTVDVGHYFLKCLPDQDAFSSPDK